MQKVDLYIEKIHSIENRKADIKKLIAPYYLEKYHKMKLEKSKLQELLAGYMLYKYLGVGSDSQIVEGPHHKPFLSSKSQFNLSHSGDYVVLAVSDLPVGVDIEKKDKIKWPVIRKLFEPAQIEYLQKIEQENPKQLQTEFAKLWTGYEAIIKLRGTGFAEKLSMEEMKSYQHQMQSIELEAFIISCVGEQELELNIHSRSSL